MKPSVRINELLDKLIAGFPDDVNNPDALRDMQYAVILSYLDEEKEKGNLDKLLKGAGFPQEGGEHLINTDNLEIYTLSQLIGACGENFDSLSLMKNGWWTAKSKLIGNKVCSAVFETPKLAVAKLWLELNKK